MASHTDAQDHLKHHANNSIIIVIKQDLNSGQPVISDSDPQQICLICYTELSGSQILAPLACGHGFCHHCFKEYIESKMKAFQVLNIHCPQADCQEIFTEAHVGKILDEAEYNRYQDLVFKKIAYKNPILKICPKPGCARPLKNHIKNKNIVCICGTSICPQCLSVSHKGKSCFQALDPEFRKYTKDHNIQCCMICKTPVFRVEGCRHMTCCVCDYEWCWDCGKQYMPKHKCTRIWNPTAPDIFRRNILSKIGNFIKTGLVLILKVLYLMMIIPLIFLAKLIFWPHSFIESSLRRKRVYRSRNPCTILAKVILSGLIGLALFPLGIMKVLGEMPIIVKKQVRHLFRKRPQKRWISGKASEFKYTGASRPSGDNDNVDENNMDNAPRNLRNTRRIVLPFVNDSMHLYHNRESDPEPEPEPAPICRSQSLPNTQTSLHIPQFHVLTLNQSAFDITKIPRKSLRPENNHISLEMRPSPNNIYDRRLSFEILPRPPRVLNRQYS